MTDYQTVGGYGPESLPGHSGSETSEKAARSRGVGKKTLAVHEFLKERKHIGATAQDVSWRFGWSHGAASGALSRLHRAGLITRTTEKRRKKLVYVDPAHLNGRKESTYTPNAAYRQDRRPMPLEAPEPTVQSVARDLRDSYHFKVPGTDEAAILTDAWAEKIAPTVLKIIQKYR